MNKWFGFFVAGMVAASTFPAAAAGKWLNTTMHTGKECAIAYAVGRQRVFSMAWSHKRPKEVQYRVAVPKDVARYTGNDYHIGINFVTLNDFVFRSSVKTGFATFKEPADNDPLFHYMGTNTVMHINIGMNTTDISLVPATNALSDFVFCKMGEKASDTEDTGERE